MTEIRALKPRINTPRMGEPRIPIITNQMQTMQTALQKMHQHLRSEGHDRYANVVDTRLHILGASYDCAELHLEQTLNT